MNKEMPMKEHMIQVFRAMLHAIDIKKKASVNIRTINRYVNPACQQTVEETNQVMSRLIDTGYIRFREFKEDRYYNASKLGMERWVAYLGASLHEITIEAERRTESRNAERPPWEVAT
jgi:hypothetical protein